MNRLPGGSRHVKSFGRTEHGIPMIPYVGATADGIPHYHPHQHDPIHRAAQLLRGPALRVYLAIKSFCDKDGRCWPRAGAIAGVCHMPDAKVRKEISALRRQGFLLTTVVKNRRTIQLTRPEAWLNEPLPLPKPEKTNRLDTLADRPGDPTRDHLETPKRGGSDPTRDHQVIQRGIALPYIEEPIQGTQKIAHTRPREGDERDELKAIPQRLVTGPYLNQNQAKAVEASMNPQTEADTTLPIAPIASPRHQNPDRLIGYHSPYPTGSEPVSFAVARGWQTVVVGSKEPLEAKVVEDWAMAIERVAQLARLGLDDLRNLVRRLRNRGQEFPTPWELFMKSPRGEWVLRPEVRNG